MPHFKDETQLFLYLNRIVKSQSDFIPDIGLDPWFEVGMKMDFKSDIKNVMSFCALNRSTSEVCRSDYFWMKKAEKDFNYPFDKLNAIEGMSGKDKYRILYQNDFTDLNSKKKYTISHQNDFIDLVSKNNIPGVILLLNKVPVEDETIEFFEASKRYTGFIEACKKNYYEIVEIMLKDGRVNPNSNGGIAVITACENGHQEIALMLLKDGRVDPNVNNGKIIKIASKMCLTKVFKALLEDPRTKLNVKYGKPIKLATKNGCKEIIKMILDDPRTNIDLVYDSIPKAVKNNDIETLKIFLANEKINLSLGGHPINDTRNTALIKAIHNGNIEIIKMLLEDGENKDGRIELRTFNHIITKNNADILKIILDYSYFEISNKSLIAYRVAASGNAQMVKLLLKDPRFNSGKVISNIFIAAAEFGHTKIIKMILKDPRFDPKFVSGFNAEYTDYRALVRASRNGHFETVKLLLENIKFSNSAVFDAFFKAREYNHSKITELLSKVKNDIIKKHSQKHVPSDF